MKRLCSLVWKNYFFCWQAWPFFNWIRNWGNDRINFCIWLFSLDDFISIAMMRTTLYFWGYKCRQALFSINLTIWFLKTRQSFWFGNKRWVYSINLSRILDVFNGSSIFIFKAWVKIFGRFNFKHLNTKTKTLHPHRSILFQLRIVIFHCYIYGR